jgi:arylsulfatase A-like enzyme
MAAPVNQFYRQLFLLAAMGIAVGSTGCIAQASRPNILLIVMDTVRVDRLSCYGHERRTTPHIDDLALSGVRFEHAYANSSWTLPSHATMFTGLHSVAHLATQETLTLPTFWPTLGEILAGGGYRTFGASTNGVVGIHSGLTRGLATFVEGFRPSLQRSLRGGRFDSPNNMAFRRFLHESDPARPFFAFINYVDAHAPYAPPARSRERIVDGTLSDRQIAEAMTFKMPDHYIRRRIDSEDFAALSQLYDAEIHRVDEKIGELLEILFADPRGRNTIVIITSDHGENLGEHGHLGHVFSLHDTLLRVPLIVVFPDGSHAGEVRLDRAQLVDLLPTILSLCGVSHDGRMDGRDLFAEGSEDVRTSVFAEYYYPAQVLNVFDPAELEREAERLVPFMRRMRSLDDGRMKLIRGSNGRHELYAIDRDPDERVDLLRSAASRAEAAWLEGEIERMAESLQGPVPPGPTPPVGWRVPGFEQALEDDPELLKRLRGLGYVR